MNRQSNDTIEESGHKSALSMTRFSGVLALLVVVAIGVLALPDDAEYKTKENIHALVRSSYEGQLAVEANSIAQSGPNTFVVPRDMKGTVAWFTVDVPNDWFVEMESAIDALRFQSMTASDVAMRYGQASTDSWGVLDISTSSNAALDEPGPEEISGIASSIIIDGSYPATRTDFEYPNGKVSSAVEMTLTNGAQILFWTSIGGAAGAQADDMRVILDDMIDSTNIVDDQITGAQWVASNAVTGVPGAVPVNGYRFKHPVGWTASPIATIPGGASVTSPSGGTYSYGSAIAEFATASNTEGVLWPGGAEVPFRILAHDTREVDASLLGSTATHAYLVRLGEGLFVKALLTNPASGVYGTSVYWLYEQHLWAVATRSTVSYTPPAYP